MSKIIDIRDIVAAKGRLLAVARDAMDGSIRYEQEAENTLFSGFIAALVSSLAKTNSNGLPSVLAFTRELIASSPQPTNLQGVTNGELRTSCQVYASGSTLQMIAILSPTQFNGGGTIKSCGLVYGATAALDVGTGTLGSLINTLSLTKDSSIELTLQYEVTFGS